MSLHSGQNNTIRRKSAGSEPVKRDVVAPPRLWHLVPPSPRQTESPPRDVQTVRQLTLTRVAVIIDASANCQVYFRPPAPAPSARRDRLAASPLPRTTARSRFAEDEDSCSQRPSPSGTQGCPDCWPTRAGLAPRRFPGPRYPHFRLVVGSWRRASAVPGRRPRLPGSSGFQCHGVCDGSGRQLSKAARAVSGAEA